MIRENNIDIINNKNEWWFKEYIFFFLEKNIKKENKIMKKEEWGEFKKIECIINI